MVQPLSLLSQVISLCGTATKPLSLVPYWLLVQLGYLGLPTARRASYHHSGRIGMQNAVTDATAAAAAAAAAAGHNLSLPECQ